MVSVEFMSETIRKYNIDGLVDIGIAWMFMIYAAGSYFFLSHLFLAFILVM